MTDEEVRHEVQAQANRWRCSLYLYRATREGNLWWSQYPREWTEKQAYISPHTLVEIIQPQPLPTEPTLEDLRLPWTHENDAVIDCDGLVVLGHSSDEGYIGKDDFIVTVVIPFLNKLTSSNVGK